MDWNLFFQRIMQTEEDLVPMFVHTAGPAKLTAVVMVAESAVGAALVSLFGHKATPAPMPTPVNVPISANLNQMPAPAGN